MTMPNGAILAVLAETALATAGAGGGTMPYGICAHLANDEFAEMPRSLAMMEVAGVQSVRADFTWRDCEREDGSFDFSRFDAVVAEAERRHIRVSPVLGAPPERIGAWREEILDAWGRYVGAVAAHFQGRIPDYEIINEADGDAQLKNPALYAKFLKRAAQEIRGADPAAKVSTSGAIRIPVEWFRGIYEAGGKDDFDILAVHPYTAPDPPEGIQKDFTSLRAMMAEYGDADKPVRFNEVGWATHKLGLGVHSTALLDLTIRIAFPDRETLRVAYADMATEDAEPDVKVAEEILRHLPPGSTSRCLSPGRLAAALAADEIDMVVILGEDYSPRIVDPLADFLRKGGVVMHGDHMPMYYARERKADGSFADLKDTGACEADRKKLRLKESAWWIDPAYRDAKWGMMTDDARRLGFKGDLGTYAARLFVEDSYLEEGDEFIRIVGGETEGGKTFTQVGIYKFNSDWKGLFAVSVLDEQVWAAVAGDAEAHQALCLARGLGLAMAMGVEAYYPYEFRAPEGNVYYSEANFGLVHDNFSPKPAWSAYTTFLSARPAGSVNLNAPWRSEDGKRYSPCWRRPDGKVAGMVWRTDTAKTETLDLGNSNVRFLNYLGAPFVPLEVQKGVFTLEIGPRPVYYVY